jgi:hypothetical protein
MQKTASLDTYAPKYQSNSHVSCSQSRQQGAYAFGNFGIAPGVV